MQRGSRKQTPALLAHLGFKLRCILRFDARKPSGRKPVRKTGTEFETEVGQERWSFFAGPTLHYASKQWWATVSWFPQIRGGREQLVNQTDTDLHLIEKTKQEVRIKVGFEF